MRDGYGRLWQLTVPRGGFVRPTSDRSTGTLAALDGLIEEALAPWGDGSPGTASQLLEIYRDLAGPPIVGEEPFLRLGDRAWGDQRDDIREVLLRAAEIGWLRCERAERPAPMPEAPVETLREPPLEPTDTEPATWFEIRVIDEVGEALTGLRLAFSSSGESRSVVTNAKGVARLEGTLASSARVRVASSEALRRAIGDRWKKPRSRRIETGSDVVVHELVEAVSTSIALQSETPRTLVIAPSFECHEISGAHFEFGRSFVRREALEPLVKIAEGLHGDAGRRAMVFGHTDIAGPADANKELSERRAKALFALLTHDAGAWEELFSGTADGAHWKEQWGVREAQHMLNALGVTDDAGAALVEDGVRGPSTRQAISRFRTGNYLGRPAEQRLLAPAPTLEIEGRRELFLAYAKRISRKKVERDRIANIGNADFMGCGELNPLSVSARDAESRRAVVFVFDPAAQPTGLPCRLRSLAPCQAFSEAPLQEPPPDGKVPYRCTVYQEVARRCPCSGGLELSHDLILRFPITVAEANELSNIYVVESEDGTIRHERALGTDARADDRQRAELSFEHLPETHLYRLTCLQDGENHVLFENSRLSDLQRRFADVEEQLLVADAVQIVDRSLAMAAFDASDVVSSKAQSDDDDGAYWTEDGASDG